MLYRLSLQELTEGAKNDPFPGLEYLALIHPLVMEHDAQASLRYPLLPVTHQPFRSH